jgi:hypothetical protein
MVGKRKPGVAAVVVLVFGTAAASLVACGAADDEVATLSGSLGPSVDSRQAGSAAEMVDCLVAKGVPAVLTPWPDGQAELDFASGESWWLCQEQDGMCYGGGGDGQSAEEARAAAKTIERFEEKYRDDLGVGYLLTEFADYTEEYRACTAMIDYIPPTVPSDPGQELDFKLAQAEAGNLWIACARDNGHPNLPDVAVPKADNYATWATVRLPMTITPGELEILLGDCPITDYGTEQWPYIGFDLPGWDGLEPYRYVRDLTAEEQAKLDPLLDVLSPHIPSAPPGYSPPPSEAAPR